MVGSRRGQSPTAHARRLPSVHTYKQGPLRSTALDHDLPKISIVANSAENILTLINTRVETGGGAPVWPASGRLAHRSWTDSVAMTLGILATTSATPADDRAAGLPSDPGRRRDDGRFEAPGASQTACRLVQRGTSPRRPAARRSRTRGDWRPSSGARRPTTSGPRGVRLINNLTL